LLAITGFTVFSCGEDNGKPTVDPCANGHNFPAWIAPSCEAAGNNERACTRSGCTTTDTRTTGFAKLDHDWEYLQDASMVMPTCETGGHGTRECQRSECGKKETNVDFDKLGHDWNFEETEHWDVILIPNCSELGEEQRTCERCDKTEERELEKDLDEHDIEVVSGKAPTCFVDGYGTIKCTRCSFEKTGDNLPAPGHHHFVDHWDEVTAATCTTAGLEERFCTRNCGEEGNRQTNPIFITENAHKWSEYSPSSAATCTEDGMQTRICEYNSSHIDTINNPNAPAFGHDESKAAATCTTPKICARAGCNVVIDPALGHQIANWTTPLTSATVTQVCDRTTCNDSITLVEYIQAHSAEGTAADTVPLKVSIELTGMATGTTSGAVFTQLLTALNTGNKLVALDLSDSYRTSNGSFITGVNTAGTRPNGLIRIASIVIPNTTVTGISDYIFYGCVNLTSVTMPANNITFIGTYAFYGCTGLTSFVIPNSVTTIGNSAFYNCRGLPSIVIPNNVTSIGNSAFQGCTGLMSIVIPNNVTTIGNSAFSGCTSLTSITIPNSVTSISNSAFQNCPGLTSITIPNSVTSIGNQSFYYCTGLTSITIPSSVTSIGTFAFSFCNNLTSVTFQRADTTINQSFDSDSLRTAYAEGGIGTYIFTDSTWAKQE